MKRAGGDMLLNENRTILLPLLDRVKQLREGYRDARRGDNRASDDAVRQILALLSDPTVCAALDPLLKDEPLTARMPQSMSDIPAEVLDLEEQLGALFGFSRSEVRHHIGKACSSSGGLNATDRISNSRELASAVSLMHEHIKGRFASRPQGFFRRLFHRQGPITEDAESAVYSIGTLIADGLHRSAFSTSYSIASATLQRGAGK